MKTKTTIILLGLWIAVCAPAAFFVSVTAAASHQGQRNYTAHADTVSATHSVSVQNYISSLEDSFRVLLELTEQFPPDSDTAQRRAFLLAIAQEHPHIIYIGVNRLSRVSNGSADVNLANRIMAEDREDSRVFLLAFSDLPTRGFALGIRGEFGGDPENGENAETLMVVFSPEVLTTLINSAEFEHGGRVAVRDSYGIMLDRGRVITTDEFYAGLARGEAVSPQIFGVWNATAIGNVQQAGRAAGSIGGLFELTVALILLGAGATLLIARSHAAPLDVLGGAVARAKRGDKSVWVDMPKRNEFGTMAARFNDFMESINPKPDETDSDTGDGTGGSGSAKKSEKLHISHLKKDAVTNAYTLESLHDYIAELGVSQEGKSFTPFAVIRVALRGFGDFLDTHSHTSGDLQLKFTALALRRALREYGLKGRIGRADEDTFLIVVNSATQSICTKVEEKITSLLRSGYTEDSGERVRVRAKLSCAVVTETPFNVYAVLASLEPADKIGRDGKTQGKPR
jgi:GGDEF domain-containing protein/HAMP domain-containing protein